MTTQPLQASIPITQAGDLPSAYLVQIIQQMAREIEALKARVQELEDA